MSVAITRKEIPADKVIESVRARSAGATVVFIGSVRSPSNGKQVMTLEYDSYARMAKAVLGEIADEAEERFGVTGISIVHRVGKLGPGEISLVVAVSSVHRDEAYRASMYIVDELKERVPIWKKEVFKDGSTWTKGKAIRVKEI